MPYVSGDSIADEILNFFGAKTFVGAGRSCPICGASIKWDWTDASDLKLHIDWHSRIGFWEISS